MSHFFKFRLSLMMFLEYVVPGATTPILSHYLKNYLHFEPYQVGYILSVLAVAAFLAPFLASHVADRYIRSERLLALCHLLCAVLMVMLAQQTRFWPFLTWYFVYGLAFTPTLGLTNAVVLHHVSDARRDFGGIRMWGTAGWVAIAWLFSFLWLRGGGDSVGRLPHALYASALASVVLAVYSLTLPVSLKDVDFKQPVTLMYWNALKVLARPSLALLCVLTFASSMSHQIYYYGMSPYLSQAEFSNAHIMPAMSMGQVSEVLVLGFLGFFLMRISIKNAMIVGLVSQAFRHVLFAFGHSTALIMVGILLHGVCYAFYFTAAYIYVDQHSSVETRAGIQQIFTIMIAGFGTFAAYVAGGYLAQFCMDPVTGMVRFRDFWLAPAVLSLIVAAVLAVTFREEPVRGYVGGRR